MRNILTIIITIAAIIGISAKSYTGSKSNGTHIESGRMYIYGVSYSPSDSMVYMTDILYIDSTQVTRRNNFLVNRNLLSKQLTKHMDSKGMPNRTNSVTFKKNLNKLDKTYRSQVKTLQKKGFVIKIVDQTEFRFKMVRDE